jgi:hypothetical protein
MNPKKVGPKFGIGAFCCPYCSTHSAMTWYRLAVNSYFDNTDTAPVRISKNISKFDRAVAQGGLDPLGRDFEMLEGALAKVDVKEYDNRQMPLNTSDVESVKCVTFDVQYGSASRCANCQEIMIWAGGKMIFPRGSGAITPSENLSDQCSAIFSEAASVLDGSPRAACALLRLCLENFCEEEGYTKGRLVDKLDKMRESGLLEGVWEALEAVRVVGNDAVHPGSIRLGDKREFADILFELMNFVADSIISRREAAKRLHALLPETKRRH